MTKKRKLNKYQRRAISFFRDIDGNPFLLTEGQSKIFEYISEPQYKRVAIKATTQYGKSDVTSMAIIMAALERKEKILIVAPSEKQASIIMGFVITHLFDNPLITSMMTYDPGSLERLKEERSKKRITFRNGSEIFILTANVRELKKNATDLMGFGCTLLIVDESGLIPDNMFAKILRMVGGFERGKLVQLGNPFEKNHFARAFKQERYHKISINWKQALAEGRLTQEFLDEAKEEMAELDWIVFYECKFPESGAEDALIPADWIENAVNQEGCEGEHKQAGLDVARFGRDKTVYIYREGGLVKAMEIQEKMDTMEVVGWTRGLLKSHKPEVIAVDVIGIGSGVFDRLEELYEEDKIESEPEPINVGAGPTDDDAKEKFMNLRAQVFWNLRSLFKPDKQGQSQISIPDDVGLKRELAEIRYKYGSERKIKIEAKEEMKKRLGMSPDKADALALAFFDTSGVDPVMFIGEM